MNSFYQGLCNVLNVHELASDIFSDSWGQLTLGQLHNVQGRYFHTRVCKDCQTELGRAYENLFLGNEDATYVFNQRLATLDDSDNISPNFHTE